MMILIYDNADDGYNDEIFENLYLRSALLNNESNRVMFQELLV